MLKKGDKVVMHTCGEAEHYKGKVWTCNSDEFTSSSKEQVVFLEGFSGYFLVKYLQVVDLKWLLKQEDMLRKIADTWVAIETNGTSEDANNFYTIVQDILTPKQD